MSFITIVDLEVFYRVGISEEERAKPQRLLLTLDIKFDFSSAAVSGRIGRTIDYYEVTQRLLKLGETRSWRLIESVATDIADKILSEFHPESVTVEVKKFSIPEARYVSVSLTKQRPLPESYQAAIVVVAAVVVIRLNSRSRFDMNFFARPSSAIPNRPVATKLSPRPPCACK